MNIDVIYYAQVAMYTALLISLPVMGISFITGLLVGIFQALTQIQDQTFAFVAKLVAVVIVLAISMSWIINRISAFVEMIYNIK